jgi:RNA polymerase sigma factor (sigma-70 family)
LRSNTAPEPRRAAEDALLRISLRKRNELSVAAHARPAAANHLAPARERELVLAAAAGDQVARKELVEAFLPAIAGVARRYRANLRVEHSELMQEGVVGLLRAMKRFDPSVARPFWAYASWWVRQAMQELVSELGRPTVLSDRAERMLARVREARRAHLQDHGREPSTAELAAASGLSRDQVESILAAELPPRMLGEPLKVSDGTAGTLGEQIADPGSQDEYERILEQVATEEIRPLTFALDKRERSILYDHYGVGSRPRTLREIARSLGLSAERVRQIEEQALEKLRAAAASTGSAAS